MKPRTEDDAVAQTPLSVKFGKDDYSIPLLTVMPQRAWRKKLFDELVPILAVFQFNSEGKTVTDGLTACLLQFPDKLAELVFAYAPELPLDKILEVATEEQLVTAFAAVMSVAFPFVPEIRRVTKILTNATAAAPLPQ